MDTVFIHFIFDTMTSVSAQLEYGLSKCDDGDIEGIVFVDYKDESQLESVMSLVGRDLSEPYSSMWNERMCSHNVVMMKNCTFF